MIKALKSFAMFWYDFVVGDDWLVALGVLLALVVTYLVRVANAPAWWVLPAAVIVLLCISLLRATRPPRRSPTSDARE